MTDFTCMQGPAPEFVQPFQEPLPPREPLAFHPLPVFEHPPFQAPAFAPPCAPRPIGFLAGYAPLLLLDMSGTMHPSKGGRFFDMKVQWAVTALSATMLGTGAALYRGCCCTESQGQVWSTLGVDCGIISKQLAQSSGVLAMALL